MTLYEWLDRFADSVNPSLGMAALALPWLVRYRAQRPAWLRVVLTLGSVATAYVVQAIDQTFRVWIQAGLDYSTHSAVCAALLVSLAHLGGAWRYATVLIGIAYAALMLYQRYHTLTDISTSALLVGSLAALIWRIGVKTRLTR